MADSSSQRNSGSSSPMHVLVEKDALVQRAVPEIDGRPSNPSSRVLPVADPRLPTVGQYQIRSYPDYKPPAEALAKVPDWRASRGGSLATALQRENLAAEQRMSDAAAVAPTHAGPLPPAPPTGRDDMNAWAPSNATAYRLQPAAPTPFREQPTAGALQTETAAEAPRASNSNSLAALADRPAMPVAITSGVNEDRAPTATHMRGSCRARADSDSLTRPMQNLSLEAAHSTATPREHEAHERLQPAEPAATTALYLPRGPAEHREDERAHLCEKAPEAGARAVETETWLPAPNEEPKARVVPSQSEGEGGQSDSGCVADALDLFEAPATSPSAVTTLSAQWALLLAEARRIRAAVAEGTVDKTLFTDADEDGDTQLHIALYWPDNTEYRDLCWRLVAGSSPSELLRANAHGITALAAAVAFGADRRLVRTLALLTCGYGHEEHEEEEDEDDEEKLKAGRPNHLLARHAVSGCTALHYAAADGDESARAIDALLDDPTDDEIHFLSEFWSFASEDSTSSTYESCRHVPDAVAGEKLRSVWKARVADAINATNERGETPLFLACKTSNVQAARRLLHYGADPCIQELSDRHSPLHKSVLLQSADLVRVLLSEAPRELVGLMLHLYTRTCENVYQLARAVQPATPAQMLVRDAIIELLNTAWMSELASAEQLNVSKQLEQGLNDLNADPAGN